MGHCGGITKHGTYIDGFAGPQNDRADMWAAKLVLESEPRWLRNFHFVEISRKKFAALEALKLAEDAVPGSHNRSINLYRGDFNKIIEKILSAGSIKPKEAAFCLLDQHTFECQWKSLTRIAAYKPAGEHKIELFYFLPIGWLDRAFSNTKDAGKIVAWWGRSDWHALRNLNNRERADAFVSRLRDELGYDSVVPWPIYEAQGSDRIMYYMIHATDHPEAPALMRRAYNRAVDPLEPIEQLKLALDTGTVDS